MRGRSLALVLSGLVACVSEADDASYPLEIPAHFPPYPVEVPTVAKAELGRLLFHDMRLSVDEARSCGICHEGKKGYTDGFVVAVGALGEPTTRNTLSLLNLAWRGPLTWVDPMMTSPREQMQTPLYGQHPVEMGVDPVELPARLAQMELYPPAFEAAFPRDEDPLTMDHIEEAILAYELLIVAGDTPYDRYLQGDDQALSADQKAGMELFFSERTSCGTCHGGLFFDLPGTITGEPIGDAPEYVNTGMYNIDGNGALPPQEIGLAAVTGDPNDMGRFRVPSLRGVAESGPWGHDGSFGDLRDVIDAYARGGRLLIGGPWPGDGRDSPFKDPRVTGFDLSEQERDHLVAFLGALTDHEANARPFLQSPFCAEGELPSEDAPCVTLAP